jgi:uncharacterized membrane protein
MSQEDDNKNGISIKTLKALSSILKEVGIIGFIVLMYSVAFFWFSTNQQKEEIVDCYILMKCNNRVCILVLIFVVAVSVIAFLYHSSQRKLMRDEIKRLGEERTKLQNKLLDISLNSSKD